MTGPAALPRATGPVPAQAPRGLWGQRKVKELAGQVANSLEVTCALGRELVRPRGRGMPRSGAGPPPPGAFASRP